MVSYLYRYKQGKREENVGYVKIDARQGQLKIYINMKDAGAKEEMPHDIYFYYHHGKQLLGVEVGKVEFINKEAEFRDTTKTANIYDSEKSLDDMGGMIIYLSSDMAYGTEWDDIPIKMGQFSGTAVEEPQVQLEEAVVAAPPAEISKEIEEQVNNLKELVQPRETVKAEAPKVEAPKVEMAKVETIKENNDFVQEAQIPKQYNRVDAPMSTIEKILMDHESLGHTGNNQILRCVRIEPQDLGKLDISNWRYGNNSFLIHGYYNYHYIILGKIIAETGKQQYVIGVPGIYGNQEKYMASQFGFRNFLPTKPTDIKTGTFGYWTAELV